MTLLETIIAALAAFFNPPTIPGYKAPELREQPKPKAEIRQAKGQPAPVVSASAANAKQVLPEQTMPQTGAGRYRADLMRAAQSVWGLDAPIAALAAQIQQESAWNPYARSQYACGLTQFTPETERWMNETFGAAVTSDGVGCTNPKWALRAQSLYMKWLRERTPGASDCERYAMSLSEYNGGEGWFSRDRALAKQRGLDSMKWFGNIETVNAGRADWAIKENRHYPRVILFTHQPIFRSWGRTECI